MIYVIGAGGVGSMLVPVVTRVSMDAVIVIDGDIVEKKNIDNQLFTLEHVGAPKAQIVAAQNGCSFTADFFKSTDTFPDNSVVFCCVDRNSARRDILRAVDDSRGTILFMCANEDDCAQVVVYHSLWRGSNLDPRIRFPNIMENDIITHIPCTSPEVKKSVPQRALQNSLAATLGIHAYWAWKFESKNLNRETKDLLTAQYDTNFITVTTKSVRDFNNE